MTDDQIYTIIAEATGLEKEYLQFGHEVQLIRPSEVVEVVRKVIEATEGKQAK
jgi:hypothetical protein